MLATVAAWGNLLFAIAVTLGTGRDIAHRLNLSHRAMAINLKNRVTAAVRQVINLDNRVMGAVRQVMAINLGNQVMEAVRNPATVGNQPARVIRLNLPMVEVAHNKSKAIIIA